MVTRTSLPIGKEPGLKIHQWNALCEANRANCLALVCWLNAGVLATIDADQAIELSRGRRSIPWNQIQKRFLHEQPGPTTCLTMLEPFLCANRS